MDSWLSTLSFGLSHKSRTTSPKRALTMWRHLSARTELPSANQCPLLLRKAGTVFVHAIQCHQSVAAMSNEKFARTTMPSVISTEYIAVCQLLRYIICCVGRRLIDWQPYLPALLKAKSSPRCTDHFGCTAYRVLTRYCSVCHWIRGHRQAKELQIRDHICIMFGSVDLVHLDPDIDLLQMQQQIRRLCCWEGFRITSHSSGENSWQCGR